jgi:thymidylate kinase
MMGDSVVADAAKEHFPSRITLYLDVKPDIALSRIKAIRKPHWDETLNVLTAYRNAYLRAAPFWPSLRIIDAGETLPGVISNAEKCIMKALT